MRKTLSEKGKTDNKVKLPFSIHKPVISDIIESLEDGRKMLVEEKATAVRPREDFDYENPAVYD